MKDYTDIFREAAGRAGSYDPQAAKAALNALPGIKCFVDSDCAYDDWFTVFDETTLYGYLHCRYPLMLCKNCCPADLLQCLSDHKIMQTALEEPMCCDETVLRLFVSTDRILDERFLDNCDYSCEDERFLKFLNRLETGSASYIDASGFKFEEILYL